MPEDMLSGFEIAFPRLNPNDRAMTDQFLSNVGQVPTITPESPQEPKILGE